VCEGLLEGDGEVVGGGALGEVLAHPVVEVAGVAVSFFLAAVCDEFEGFPHAVFCELFLGFVQAAEFTDQKLEDLEQDGVVL
jgi:hypothetical protein